MPRTLARANASHGGVARAVEAWPLKRCCLPLKGAMRERVRCAGRRSEPGGRMAQEREHGRSRDSEAGSHRGSHRDRSSDSGFASEASSRYPSGALAPMGSSGLPLSPSQGPLPPGEPAPAPTASRPDQCSVALWVCHQQAIRFWLLLSLLPCADQVDVIEPQETPHG